MAKFDQQPNGVRRIFKKGSTKVSIRVEPTDTKVFRKDDGTVLIEKTDVTKTITTKTPDRTILVDQNSSDITNIKTNPANKPMNAFQNGNNQSNKLATINDPDIVAFDTVAGQKQANKTLKAANKQAKKVNRKNRKAMKNLAKQQAPRPHLRSANDSYFVNTDFKLGNATELLRQIDEDDKVKVQNAKLAFKQKVDENDLPIEPELLNEETVIKPVARVEDDSIYHGPEAKRAGSLQKLSQKLSSLQKQRADVLLAKKQQREHKLLEKEERRRVAIEEKAYKDALKRQLKNYKTIRAGFDPEAQVEPAEMPDLHYYETSKPKVEYSRNALLAPDRKQMIHDVSMALKNKNLGSETFSKHHQQRFVRVINNDRYNPWRFRYENSTWGLHKGFKFALTGSLICLLAIVLFMVFAIWAVDVFARNDGSIYDSVGGGAEAIMMYLIIPLISLVVACIGAAYLITGCVYIVNYRYEINTYTILSLLTSCLFLFFMIFSFVYWIGYFEHAGIDLYQNHSGAAWISMTVLFVLFSIATIGTLIAQAVIATYKYRSIPYCVTRY